MRLLQFNILESCINDDARLKRIGNFIKSNAYDVIGLNEAPLTIDQIGKEWGYEHSQIGIKEKRKSFVAILSKYPIRLLDMYSTLFHHSMLHVNILNYHFIATHLDSLDSLLREKEALLIKDIVMKVNDLLIVMGDLNNLSPLDKKYHEDSNIRQLLQGDKLLWKKFLNPGGDINYRPIEHLLDAGLVDIFDKLGARTYTVPTQYNTDIAHATKMRLDYMLVNRRFNANFKVRVIQDEITDSLSDHYPLECVWDMA